MPPIRAQAAPAANDPAIHPDLIRLHAAATTALHAALRELLHGNIDRAAMRSAIARATRAATHCKRMAMLLDQEGGAA